MRRLLQIFVFFLAQTLVMDLSYKSIRPHLEAFETPWYLTYLNHNIKVPLESPDRFLNRTRMKNVKQCPQMRDSYDFIIIGSGSAGSVLANRLSEMENVNILVLEAGDEPFHVSYIPLITFQALWQKQMDWQFKTEPQKYCCQLLRNQIIYYNRGKCLGGTSSINFMTYTRANRMDLDNWAKLGNKGWSYDDLFPYYLKLEDYQVVRDFNNPYEKYHNVGGPMTVEIPSFKSSIAEAFLQGGFEMKYPLIDYNGPSQIGFMYPPVSIRNGSRCSTYVAYLKPAMKRKNLQVLTNSYVTKILIDDNNKATGVQFDYYKAKCTAKATKEVIVSAGVIQSPQLLMLSGIGPKKTLDKFKIPVKKNVPGVGQNFQDHVIFGGNLYSTGKKYTYNNVRYETPENVKLWEKTGTGPMTCPVSFEGVAYIATKYSENKNWSDIEIFFNSDNALRIFKPYAFLGLDILVPPNSQDTVLPGILLLRPKSRGYVTLRSADPHAPPIIEANLLKDIHDVDTMVEGSKIAKKLMQTKAMQQFLPRLFLDGFVPTCILSLGNKKEYDRCVIRQVTSSGFHPVGTCKMGNDSDPMAVVDSSLRVNGFSGLRVIDASVFPLQVAAHPQVTIIAMAEKISDEIKKQYPN